LIFIRSDGICEQREINQPKYYDKSLLRINEAFEIQKNQNGDDYYQ